MKPMTRGRLKLAIWDGISSKLSPSDWTSPYGNTTQMEFFFGDRRFRVTVERIDNKKAVTA